VAGDGTSFEIDLQISGADSYESAAASAARLATRLDTASAAAATAADAVKAGEASYNAAERAANGAAKSVERIGLAADAQAAKAAKAAAEYGLFSTQYQKASDKLQALTARQSEAAQKSAAAKAALDAEAAALDKLKASAAAASAQQDKLTKAQTAAKAKADELKKSLPTGNLQKIGSELSNFGGPLGAVAGKVFGTADAFGDLKEAMGSGGIYAAIAVGVVAIATAAVTLTAAAVAGVAAITSWAVSLADFARTEKLLAAGAQETATELAGSAAAGRQLMATIDGLRTRVPLTTTELLNMADGIRKTGVEGAALSSKLEEAAIKAARLKFGPQFEKQLLALPVQTQKLKDNFFKLFSGLNISALLKSFKQLVDLFDASSASGRAIKVVFESLFQPLVNGIAAWIPRMVGAFIQFEILVLKALIAIKPFGSKILAVAEVFGWLALVVAAMAVGFTVAVIAPFAVIIGLAAALVAAVMQVVGTFMNLYNTLSGMSLAEIGTAMIQGLANGITSAGGAVLSAITGVVSGAINAAKGLLGIASPSKVFAEIGANTAEGMSGGVDDGAGDVQGSLESMVAPPAAASGASASGGGGAAAGIIIQGDIIVQAPAGSDPRSFAEQFRDELYNLRIQAGLAGAG